MTQNYCFIQGLLCVTFADKDRSVFTIPSVNGKVIIISFTTIIASRQLREPRSLHCAAVNLIPTGK